MMKYFCAVSLYFDFQFVKLVIEFIAGRIGKFVITLTAGQYLVQSARKIVSIDDRHTAGYCCHSVQSKVFCGTRQQISKRSLIQRTSTTECKVVRIIPTQRTAGWSHL